MTPAGPVECVGALSWLAAGMLLGVLGTLALAACLSRVTDGDDE